MSYRKTIRIDGKEKKSPRFKRSSDAELWYVEQYRLKQFKSQGIEIPLDGKITLDEYFYSRWVPSRKKSGYPKSTWGADVQRYRDYVSPEIGRQKLIKIQQLQIRLILKNIVDSHGRSVETRNRVRSLLSKLFNDAMNEDPPLRKDNPAVGISFNDPRKGKKKPRYLKSQTEIVSFLKAAKSIGDIHYVYAGIMLMAALRKQEIIPLKWNDHDKESSEILVDEKYIQSENRIVSGTKAGTDESRIIPISDDLNEMLIWWRKKSKFNSNSDFILCRDDGAHIPSRDISRIHNRIRDAAGADIHPHGLRHSYGRWFIKNGGSLKELQAILGHSNSVVTELYSQLAAEDLRSSRNRVRFSVEDGEK